MDDVHLFITLSEPPGKGLLIWTCPRSRVVRHCREKHVCRSLTLTAGFHHLQQTLWLIATPHCI